MNAPNQIWFTSSECCKALSMESSMFRGYIEKGIFPRGIRRGKRRLVWHADDLTAMEWLEKNRHRLKRSTTPEPVPAKGGAK